MSYSSKTDRQMQLKTLLHILQNIITLWNFDMFYDEIRIQIPHIQCQQRRHFISVIHVYGDKKTNQSSKCSVYTTFDHRSTCALRSSYRWAVVGLAI